MSRAPGGIRQPRGRHGKPFRTAARHRRDCEQRVRHRGQYRQKQEEQNCLSTHVHFASPARMGDNLIVRVRVFPPAAWALIESDGLAPFFHISYSVREIVKSCVKLALPCGRRATGAMAPWSFRAGSELRRDSFALERSASPLLAKRTSRLTHTCTPKSLTFFTRQ